MRTHLWLSVLIVLIAAQACVSTPVPVGTATPAPAATEMPDVSPTPALTPTPALVRRLFEPGPVYVKPARAGFGHIVTFAEEPDPDRAARAFAEGTKKIYAMWDYSGMRDGQIVRRDWYLDGKLWLTREEPWDLSKYGAAGTIKDIAIQDQETGLPSGHYELALSIDGVSQLADVDDTAGRSFSVGTVTGVTSGTGGLVMSPDGKLGALIDAGKLSIVDEQGQVKLLSETNTLGVSWMPDSQNLVYSAVTRTGMLPFELDIYLILENISTGEQVIITEPPLYPHYPIVSPNGRYITIYHNNYYGDGDGGAGACNVNKRRAFFIELDPVSHRHIGEIQLDSFAGLPADSEGAVMVSGPDFAWPGVWQGPTTFKIALRFRCGGESNDGVYLVDVAAKSLTKTVALPAPQ